MRRARSIGTLVVAVCAALSLASEAAAQRRGGRGHGGHQQPVVRYSYSYAYLPGFFHYGGFWPHYALGFPYAYPTGPARAEVRLQVKPADTQVYVDGYYAGIADDFDGLFQRLHLAPGEHTLELYRDDHRIARQALYVNPGGSYKVHFEMDELAPGEEAPSRPRPAERPRSDAPRDPATAPPQISGALSPDGFGVLELHSQPRRTQVWVDGKRWPGSGEDELVLHLRAGRHALEVRSEGHETFATEIEVSRGETTRLNVILPRQTAK